MPPKKKGKKGGKKKKKKVAEHAEVVRKIELAAAQGNDMELYQELQMGYPKAINYDLKNGKAGYAMVRAAQHGRKVCAQTLLDHGGQVDYMHGKPLLMACRAKQMEMVKWLIDKKASVNCSQDPSDFTQMSPLMHACKEKSMVLVQYLLSKGANPNQTCHPRNCGFNNGWSALHFAADEGDCDIVDVLLKAQANPDLATPNEGDTALGVAAEHGRFQVVEFMVKMGAKINVKRRGMNATQWAIYRAEDKYVQFLVSYGGLPNLNSTILWFQPQQTLAQKIATEYDPAVARKIDLAIYRGQQELRQRATLIRVLCQVTWENEASFDPYSMEGAMPTGSTARFSSRVVSMLTELLSPPPEMLEPDVSDPDF